MCGDATQCFKNDKIEFINHSILENIGITWNKFKFENKVCFPEATKKGYVAASIGQGIDIQYPNSQTRRGRLIKDKAHCIQAGSVNQGIINEKYNWRKLTPIECERLQTVPDNYTEGVSNSQRYKMLGNGWTVKVIEHVLTNMDV